MNVNDIYIDGVKYTPFIKGLDGLKITYTKTDNFIGYGLSSELEFMKDAADLIYNTFFADACDGKDALLDVEVVVYECCAPEPITFTFVIDFEGVTLCRWGNECLARVELKTYGECQKGYEYLRDTVFFADGFAQDETHYKVPYCRQPKQFFLWRQIFQMILPMLIILQLIESILKLILGGIVNILTIFGILPSGAKDIINQFIEENLDVPSVDNALAVLTGCGWFHFADNLKEILDYNITKANAAAGCTIVLDAPILEQGEYADTAFIWSQEKRGISCLLKNNALTGLYEERAANIRVLQLVNQWREVVNHEAVILPDGTFKIDTYENLVNAAPVLFYAETDFVKYGLDMPPCYEFAKAEYCSTTTYEYQQDEFDQEGNKRRRSVKLNELPAVPSYMDVVKWDEDSNSINTVACQKSFEFGAVRAMFDFETTNAQDGFFDPDEAIDRLRNGNFIGMNLPAVFEFFSDEVCLPREHDLILAEHQTSLPKCVVLNTDDPNEAFIKHTDFGNLKIYNRPYHLFYTSPAAELIKNFHEETDNPAHENYRLMVMESFKTKMTAGRLATIVTNGSYFAVNTRYGLGLPEEVILDFADCTITVQQVKLKCQQSNP